MLILEHTFCQKLLSITANGQLLDSSDSLCNNLWKLAEDYPEELIVWVDSRFQDQIDFVKFSESDFPVNQMKSFAIETSFFGNEIGYIDQLPFVNVNRKEKFPTWQMSSDIGGIYAKSLLPFKHLLSDIKDFNYLINSIAKIGQQNGLLCYSDPFLVKNVKEEEPKILATQEQVFDFVHQHYNTEWNFVMFWAYLKYEKTFPILPFLKSFRLKKLFKAEIELPAPPANSEFITSSIDVIIPTIGREKYLNDFLKDLKHQEYLPKNVIIIEQDPDASSKTHLSEILNQNWPFIIIHRFTHQTGACNARNIALQLIESDWVFMADDDIRISNELLKNALLETQRLQVDCINFNCKQENQETVFKKIKQWGSFGSGTAMVKSKFAKSCTFPMEYEHGFGEDSDFGMQLRNLGVDIIYHPSLKILHLKAPIGGLRTKVKQVWEKIGIEPKPSPTIMLFSKKYFSQEQLKGFKISLFLKYYRKQDIKNPYLYIKKMQKRWKLSEYWASAKFKQIYK